MTRPQDEIYDSAVPDSERFPLIPLPIHARVPTGRWWLGGIMSLVITLFLGCAVVGIPESFFQDPSPMMSILRVVAVVGVPLAAYCTWYYLNGAIRPQHLTIDDDGVSTPRWRLTWAEIYGVDTYPSAGDWEHKQQLHFAVTDEAFARVRALNRAHSGRPFHMGGMLPTDRTIRTQYGMRPTPGDLMRTIQEEADHRNVGRPVPAWARHMGPYYPPAPPRAPESRS